MRSRDEDRSFVYRATFTPTNSRPVEGGTMVAGLPGDRATNNEASAAVVARGIRQVLFVDKHMASTGQPEHQYLIQLMLDEKISVVPLSVDKLPTNKADLGVLLSNYDALIMGNVPAESFTHDQMEIIRSSVFDQGCGLVMIGGPDSFGPGGYQIDADRRSVARRLRNQSTESGGQGWACADHARLGNGRWQQLAKGNRQTRHSQARSLRTWSALSIMALLAASSGTSRSNPSARTVLVCLLKSMRCRLETCSDYNPYLRAAADTLSDPEYNLSVKHCILISDGDGNYSGPGQAAVADMAANNITCTTVGVATHGAAENSRLQKIAEGTKDGSGKPGSAFITSPTRTNSPASTSRRADGSVSRSFTTRSSTRNCVSRAARRKV